MIDGHTQLFGIIGNPVEHSLSPAMHNAAFEPLGLNYRYFPFPIKKEELREAISRMRARQDGSAWSEATARTCLDLWTPFGRGTRRRRR